MNLLLNHSETRRCGWRERAALLLLVCAASLYLSSITSNPSLDDVHMQRPQHEAPPPHSLRRRLWGRSRERQQRQQQVQREESLVNFLDPKSVELRHDVMYDSWHSNNQRPLTVTAAEAEEVSTTSLEVMGDLPPVLSGDYVSEEDYDAAYRAAQEEQLSSSPSDRRQYSIIQPYTLEDALSESNVFKKIFALIVYDPPSDRFIGLYSKDHQINGMGARLIHSTRTLVYMLRHIFPERFTPDMPELVLAISSGDYPSVHVSKLPHTNGAAPVLTFGSAFRNPNVFPNMIAMPMPDSRGFHLDCFEEFVEYNGRVCKWFRPAGSGSGGLPPTGQFSIDEYNSGDGGGGELVFGDESLGWNDLIPQVVWRGADFGFLSALYSKNYPEQTVQFGGKERDVKRIDAIHALDKMYDRLLPRWQGVTLTAEAELRAETNGGGKLPWANIKVSSYSEHGIEGKQPTVGSDKYKEWESVGIATGKGMSLMELARYKYHIDIGGGGGTTWTGTIQKLAMPGLLFHHLSPTKDYIHDRLRPWRHYIPVSTDFMDLKRKFDWAESHPEQAKRIAYAGTEFMRWLGSPEGFEQVLQEDFVEPLRRVIEAYRPVSTVHPEMSSWKELLQSMEDKGRVMPFIECSGVTSWKTAKFGTGGDKSCTYLHGSLDGKAVRDGADFHLVPPEGWFSI